MSQRLFVLFLIGLVAMLFACGSAELASHKIPDGQPGAKAYLIQFDGL